MNDVTKVVEGEVMDDVVTTTLGNVPKSDLRIDVKQAEETVDAWVWVRECFYTGTKFPEAVNTIVRRDVWVTMKSGQAAKAESKL